MAKHFSWLIYLFNAHTLFCNKFVACDIGPGVRLKLGVSLGISRTLRTQHILCTPSDGVSPFSAALRRPAGIFFFLKTWRTHCPWIQFDHVSSWVFLIYLSVILFLLLLLLRSCKWQSLLEQNLSEKQIAPREQLETFFSGLILCTCCPVQHPGRSQVTATNAKTYSKSQWEVGPGEWARRDWGS